MSAADDYEIGVTGARFGPAPRRWRRDRERARTEYDGPPGEAMPVVEQTDALPAHAGAAHAEQSSDVPFGARAERPEPGVDDGPGGTGEMAGSAAEVPPGGSRVRPYFYTKGRTRSRYELAVETLVTTAPSAFGRPDLVEHRDVLELCRQPHSVAEVGALLHMPLGVARVVVGDLAGCGGLVVHRNASAADGPDLALMERVLSGLRKL